MTPSMEYGNATQSGYAHKKFNCGYTHKKFGSRMVERNSTRENGANKENLQLPSTLITTVGAVTTVNMKQTKDIFRPYALDNATPRKRKLAAAGHLANAAKRHMPESRVTTAMPIDEPSRQKHQTVFSQTARMASATVSYEQHIQYQQEQLLQQQLQYHHHQLQHLQQQPFAINKQAFALMLQKQRAALYMRNLMKFNGNGNGWPTLLNPSLILGNSC